jgi:hypothetical protein
LCGKSPDSYRDEPSHFSCAGREIRTLSFTDFKPAAYTSSATPAALQCEFGGLSVAVHTQTSRSRCLLCGRSPDSYRDELSHFPVREERFELSLVPVLSQLRMPIPPLPRLRSVSVRFECDRSPALRAHAVLSGKQDSNLQPPASNAGKQPIVIFPVVRRRSFEHFQRQWQRSPEQRLDLVVVVIVKKKASLEGDASVRDCMCIQSGHPIDLQLIRKGKESPF